MQHALRTKLFTRCFHFSPPNLKRQSSYAHNRNTTSSAHHVLLVSRSSGEGFARVACNAIETLGDRPVSCNMEGTLQSPTFFQRGSNLSVSLSRLPRQNLNTRLILPQDAKHGQVSHFDQILRELYLTRGRCSRQDQPVQIRVRSGRKPVTRP